MITKLKQFKESKLVPRNVEGRMEKLRQQNLKLLQQETFEGNILVDDSWNFSPEQVRTRTINGRVTVEVCNGKILKWLENVTVNGNFYCLYNKLTSLEGCPKTMGGNFSCSNNELTSLEGCPQTVGGSFYCSHNELISLKGCPHTVNVNFSCSNNKLTSLEGCPQTVGGSFSCEINKLTSLEGCPQTVGGDFYCSKNTIKFTEKDIPKNVVIKGGLYF